MKRISNEINEFILLFQVSIIYGIIDTSFFQKQTFLLKKDLVRLQTIQLYKHDWEKEKENKNDIKRIKFHSLSFPLSPVSEEPGR